MVPSHETWNHYNAAGPNRTVMHNRFLKAFRTSSSKLGPDSDDKDKTVPQNSASISKKKWRSAGPLSHQRSAAAVAYILADSRTGFANISSCWTGRVRSWCAFCA